MGPWGPGVNINGDVNIIDNDSIDGGINDLDNGDGNDGNDDELGGVPGARVYCSKWGGWEFMSIDNKFPVSPRLDPTCTFGQQWDGDRDNQGHGYTYDV